MPHIYSRIWCYLFINFNRARSKEHFYSWIIQTVCSSGISFGISIQQYCIFFICITFKFMHFCRCFYPNRNKSNSSKSQRWQVLYRLEKTRREEKLQMKYLTDCLKNSQLYLIYNWTVMQLYICMYNWALMY